MWLILPLQQRPAWWFGKVWPINQLQISICFAHVQQHFSGTGFISWWILSILYTYLPLTTNEKSNWHPESRPLSWSSFTKGTNFSHLPTAEQTFVEHRLCTRPHDLYQKYENRLDSLPYITSSLHLEVMVPSQTFSLKTSGMNYILEFSLCLYCLSLPYLSSELFTFPKSNLHHNLINFLKFDTRSSPSWICLNPSCCGEKTGSLKQCRLIFTSNSLY